VNLSIHLSEINGSSYSNKQYDPPKLSRNWRLLYARWNWWNNYWHFNLITLLLIKIDCVHHCMIYIYTNIRTNVAYNIHYLSVCQFIRTSIHLSHRPGNCLIPWCIFPLTDICLFQFWRFTVRIFVGTPTNLTENFRCLFFSVPLDKCRDNTSN
jgi:hypothetical protein